MKLKGANSGSDNGTYYGALEFFKKREAEQKVAKAEAVKENRKRKRDEAESGNENASAPSPNPLLNDETIQKIQEIVLESENVYDDCDEVRRKLSLLIQSPGMTQTRACKLIDCNSNALNKFLSKKGSNEGNWIAIFISCYSHILILLSTTINNRCRLQSI